MEVEHDYKNNNYWRTWEYMILDNISGCGNYCRCSSRLHVQLCTVDCRFLISLKLGLSPQHISPAHFKKNETLIFRGVESSSEMGTSKRNEQALALG